MSADSDLSVRPDALAAARLFDALGLTYERTYQLPEQLAAIDWLLARLPARGRVMDVGSGTGRPTAERIAAEGHEVMGYDVSATMVEQARAQVPAAQFARADVRNLPDRPENWDAVTAFFPFLQMSRADLEATLTRIAGWLRPGGYFLFATVPFDAEDTEMDWMGHRVRATSYPAEVYPRLLRAVGLNIVHERLSVFHPDFPGMGAEEHLFIYARKPGGSAVAAHALAAPYPHPRTYRGPHQLSQDGWLGLESRFERHDITPIVDALAANCKVLDVGGGSGAVVQAIAARLGCCTTVEPNALRAASMHALPAQGVTVLPGKAECLPLVDASVDAAVATWILHYTGDPATAVREMARVVDAAHPEATIVLVQGAPDNQLIGLWNQLCAPLINQAVDHQGYLLTCAATVLAAHGFDDLAWHRVPVRVLFPESGPDAKAAAAADALAGFWNTGHPQQRELRAALLPVLTEHFATGTDSLSDDGVLLIARPAQAGLSGVSPWVSLALLGSL